MTQKWAKFLSPDPNKLEDCHYVTNAYHPTSYQHHCWCINIKNYHGHPTAAAVWLLWSFMDFLLHPLELKQLIQNWYRLTFVESHPGKRHDSEVVTVKLNLFSQSTVEHGKSPFSAKLTFLPWVETKKTTNVHSNLRLLHAPMTSSVS